MADNDSTPETPGTTDPAAPAQSDPANAEKPNQPEQAKTPEPKKGPDPSMLLRKKPEPTPEPEAEKPAKAPDPEAKGNEPAPSEPTDEPNKGHNPDKAIQKLQQDVGNIGRALSDLTSTITGIESKITDQGGKATPEQQQELDDAKGEVENVKADLDKYLESEGDFLLEDDEAPKVLVREIKRLSSELDGLKANTEAEKAEIRQKHDNEAAARDFRESFAKEHPAIAERVDDLIVEARTLLDEQYPDLQGDARIGAGRAIWDQVVKRAESDPSTKEPGAAPGKPKPPAPSRKPDKSPVGTHNVQSAARTAPPTTDQKLSNARAKLIRRS